MAKIPFATKPTSSDEELAQQFLDALNRLSEIMTTADKCGITCGFKSIVKRPNGQYMPEEPFANKKLV